MPRRWLFGDQLGPHFLDRPDQPVLLVESRAVLRRRAFHRQKAHLVLSAIRHRAAELGDQALVLRTATFREALGGVDEPVDVCQPTTRAALRLVRSLPGVTVLPARGFVTSSPDFVAWADNGHSRLRMDDFYRYARARHGVLMVDGEPAGGRFTFDAEAPNAPDAPDAPEATPAPAAPLALPPDVVEDDIDDEVRHDLDRWEAEGARFVGVDGPRAFPATRAEALARLHHFVEHRLPHYAAQRDRMSAEDPLLAHSLLSAPLNLGLLDPLEVIRLAERAYLAGHAPLASVEAFCRQLLGWRDYVWHLYWYFTPEVTGRARPRGETALPAWLYDLDADAVSARCLADALAGVRDRGWVHDTSRRMILGNYATQRGWPADEVTDWFHRSFVDGHTWALTGNVAGLSSNADLAVPARSTVAQGAAIDRVSDHCGECPYAPRMRLGDHACPFTAGYWTYLAQAADTLHTDPALRSAARRLHRITDIADVVEQETKRGNAAP